MEVHHTASIVVDILSTVESDTNLENDNEGSQLSMDIEEWSKDLGGDEDMSLVDQDNSTATCATVEGENNPTARYSSSNL